MTPEQWQRVFALVKASQERGESEPTSFLARNCAGEEELLSAAKSLLLAQKQMGSFLEQPGSRLAFVNGKAETSRTGRALSSIAEESRALARGSKLGRYVVLDLLGTGGMGVVYAAYDPDLDRKLAIKLLHPEATKGLVADRRARLLREGQALARLSHTNVVAIHDVGALGDDVFIAMEYVDGCTLKGWLKAERREWPEIVAMFVQAGRGLAAAHSAGIVHRDFKPDNVLVGKDGRARVLDFGLARSPVSAQTASTVQLTANGQGTKSIAPKLLADAVTIAGTLIGTPAYMSPEQIAGSDVDPRTDQFSFCAALYQALYGELPFDGYTLIDRLAAIREGNPRHAKAGNRPRWLHEAVLKGLHSEPAARYPTMEALLHKLEQNRVKVWRRVRCSRRRGYRSPRRPL
jgi:serine/threonine protein kinase